MTFTPAKIVYVPRDVEFAETQSSLLEQGWVRTDSGFTGFSGMFAKGDDRLHLIIH